MSNIDWKFIAEREGNKLKGYVPNADKSKSGVTIASGFDLGARSLEDLKGLPQDIIDLLQPFLGLKGAEASEVASNLKVSNTQSNIINDFAKKEATETLSRRWKETTGEDFSKLPMNKATAVASVAFQYGNLETETPNYWRQVTSGDWNAAEKNLRDFQDDYGTRRNLEADYLVAGMTTEEVESKKKFESELARDKQYGIQQAMISGEEGGLGSAPTVDTSQPPQEVIQDLDIPAETVETLPITEEVMEEPNIQKVPQDSGLSETLPTPGDIYGGYTQLYGNGEQYGQRIPSKLNEADEYDYRVFDEDGWDIWGAAFRQHNFIPSLVRMISATDSKYQPVADYEPFQDKELISKVGSDGTWRFRNSKSPAESMMLYERMKQDSEDMMLLNSTPSVSKQLVAGLATPTTFAPIAPLKVLQSANRTRRFVGGSAFTAALTAPEQLLIDSQNTQRDTSHTAIILTGASLLGGGLSVAFGKSPKIIPQEQKLLTDKVTVDGSGFPDGGEALYRPAGAGVSPEKAREAAYAQMEKEALVETGIGIEKVGWNPVTRMLKSENPFVRNLTVGMVDVGGMMQKKVTDLGLEMDQSVETTFRTTYLSKLLDSVRASDEAYLAYRNISVPKTDAGRAVTMMKTKVTDMVKGGDSLGEVQFRHRVSMAMRRGDVDEMNDAASPYVAKAAKEYRKTFDFIKKEAESVRLFERELQKQIDEAVEPSLKAELTEKLKKLREQGVTANNAVSYLPRIYRVDKIMDNQQGFLSIVESYARRSLRLDAQAAKSYANDVLDTVTHRRPYVDLEGVSDNLDWIKTPSGAQARTLDIPDDLLEEFLENDVETLLRHHVKTMGMDIELTRKYGDVSMSGVLDEVTQEYNRLMGKVSEKIDNMVTGQSISVKVHRGSGGKGKVSFEESALGDGLYFATNAKTASRFGKQVDEVDITLKNPLKITSDDELMALFRQAGLNADELQAAKKAYDDFMSAMAEKRKNLGTGKSLAENKKLTDEWFSEFDSGYNKVAGNYSSLRQSYMKQLRQWAESNGHDSISINFGLDDFDQVTKGKLTPLKIMDEYSNVAGKGGRHQILEETFSHDQIVVFNKKFDDYGSVGATRNQADIVKLEKAMEADLRDVRGLRDRLRGTYGASKDPHALSSRFVRNMKSINTLAGMGSAVVSSVPDVARLVMVEGFENAYSKGFSTLFNRQSKIIRQLGKKELDQAAIAVDATLGLRSHAMSDLGDLFGSRYTIERKLNQATGMFFLFNGLNIWNQALKEMAGNMTMLRMTEGLMKPWSKLTKADQEKFLKNGIGQQDHMRMQQQIRQFGKQEGKEWLPESEAWTDATMRLKFRNALNQNVERIIITPGAGDRALWTSTEFGSMLTQFKSYGQGAMVRMLTAGLQEKDGAFWQGAFLIVGLAGIINEIKRLQYGIDSDEDVGTKLINAIDRSGIGGWFTDVNNAIEKISDHKLGMRPFFTDQPQYQMPFGAKAGAVAGPTASNLINMADVASDVITFNADEKTLRNSRFFFPTGNLFYLDPIYDGVFGEGNVNRQQTGNRE